MELDLVDEPRGQRLLRDTDAAGQQHVLAVRVGADLVDGGLDAAGDERVAGAAELLARRVRGRFPAPPRRRLPERGARHDLGHDHPAGDGRRLARHAVRPD
jgi:hypothetical protein